MIKDFSNTTVLYVEDDSFILDVTSETLQMLNINVIKAKDGLEGLEIFKNKSNEIDLILADIKMPRMNGLEMLENIRKISSETPAIITTAHEEINFLKLSIELNVNSYITKPIDINLLSKAIAKSLEPVMLKKELKRKNLQLENEISINQKKHQLMLSQARFASMGEMINMIAHQWRQPLASIGTATFNIQFRLDTKQLYSVKEEKLSDERMYIKKKLFEISNYVQNLTTTIDDFRNFFKTDKISTEVTLNSLIESSLNIISETLLANNIEVIKKDFSNPYINVIENEIVHVLLNLLKNSQDNFELKNKASKQIIISTEEDNTYAKIKVEDNGGGIDEKIIDQIFDPYFSTKKVQHGTGIGLYMSKIIIEQNHNGKLDVENTIDGVIFSIALPKRDTKSD